MGDSDPGRKVIGLFKRLWHSISNWWHIATVPSIDRPTLVQTDPLSPDEILLRRILYSQRVEGIFKEGAFDPSSSDTDGISLFREYFIDAKSVAEAGKNPSGYYVVRLKYCDLSPLVNESSNEEFQLTIDPTPNDDLPGHVVIREVKRNLAGDAKGKMRKIKLALAQLANKSECCDYTK